MKNINQFTNTLERRRRMADIIEQSLKEAPEETTELLSVIGKAYYSGKISHFWNFLSSLTGNERGYGNDWFFVALETQKQIKETKNE